MRNYIFLLFLFLVVFQRSIDAEPVCHFRHYSSEDGLPQYTIMDMLQDKSGFMWFATWDGLSKFDGYKFHNYKVQPGDDYEMKSNRIERIFEDRYGRIWLISYHDEVHCFNPRTESFWGLQSVKGVADLSFKISRVQVNQSGKVWLLSAGSGCVEVTDSAYNTVFYNRKNGKLKTNNVLSVFEDCEMNSWLLTDNGLCLVAAQADKKPTYFFSASQPTKSAGNAFYTAVEVGGEIWFGANNGRIWKFSKASRKFKLLDLQLHSEVKNMVKLPEQRIVITTANDGFLICNSENGELKRYSTQTLNGLKSNKIISCFYDKSGGLWLETDKVGAYRFDVANQTITYFFVKTEDIYANVFPARFIALSDVNGKVWVQPKGGGFSLYNKAANQLEPYFSGQNSSEVPFSNILHSGFTDKQGNLWLCTRSHGLEKITFDKMYFKTMKINADRSDVRVVFEDNERNLWVATRDRRLTVFNSAKKMLGRFSADGTLRPDALFPGVVYSMMQDADGNIWIGTKSEGLFKIRKILAGNRYKIENFKRNPEDIFSLSGNSVYSVFQDSKRNIWIGSYGGGLNLVKYLPDGKTYFINQFNNLKNYPADNANMVRYVTQDNRGHVCVGTTGGLLVFSNQFSLPESIRFRQYSKVKGKKESLSNNDVHEICITTDNEMFIATFGGGVNKVTEYDKNGFPLSFKQYTVKNGLASDVTLAIREDDNKTLWISTENNLTKFNPQTEIFETFAEIKRLMTVNSFSESATCKTSSNELIFGYSNGILMFKPSEIINSNFKPHISFSDFLLFNKSVPISAGSPLTNSIDHSECLKLTHKQNFFSIEYASLDFVDPENILYAYKLDGFDKDWNYVQKQRIANYTNLPKGKYVFRLKSTNSEGVWVENERQLPIEVLPSFWETPLAYMLYVALFLALVFLCVYVLFTFYHLRADVEMEKNMSEMKLRFFTDISHEIRTPLTMITAPVEFMMNDATTPEPIKKQLKMISQSTNRLLRLVNQILDFRKIQFIHLKVSEVEIASFVENICDNFTEIAEMQHITFRFENQAADANVWVDPDCLEKIVMNLLSNAFKFTPAGKSIRVFVRSDEKRVSVEISDEGVGVPREKQKRLFTRFASFNEDKSKPSTGIGLSMVKELAEKHAAKLTVESEEGKGSSFIISFLRGTEHFGNNVEIQAATGSQSTKVPETEFVSSDSESIENISFRNAQPSILIVEDDSELRSFIKSILQNDYTIYESEDGVDGLEKALKYCPDFVVSDIMMPRMDGVELLQRLKKEATTSHIPVVLLTAKTTIESKLEGLAFGADDYITKPFSVAYFQARIANLIEQRNRLQEIFRAKLLTHSVIEQEPQPFFVSAQDNDMMAAVMQFIDDNLNNSEFQIDDIAQHIGMSRSAFFKKLKALTGFAPVEFIRDVKMQKAAQLLSTNQLLVKEVAYMVGVSDTKYFTKCFKEKYGMTPLEYKNKLTIDNG